MSEKDMELEELNLDDIMKQFGGSEIPLEDEQAAELEDTRDLLEVIDRIGSEEVQEAPDEEPARGNQSHICGI